jgi:hypothetical protein
MIKRQLESTPPALLAKIRRQLEAGASRDVVYMLNKSSPFNYDAPMLFSDFDNGNEIVLESYKDCGIFDNIIDEDQLKQSGLDSWTKSSVPDFFEKYHFKFISSRFILSIKMSPVPSLILYDLFYAKER